MGTRSQLVATTACLLLLAGCRENTSGPSDIPPATSPATSAGSGAPKAPPPPRIVGSTVEGGHASDDGPWFESFKFSWPDGAPVGATWWEARKACQAVGLDLCSQEQWLMACRSEPAVGKATSWTISFASGDRWIVRGGSGCAASSDGGEDSIAPGRIGLCCERRAGISSGTKSAAILRSAHVYANLVEKAMNSGSPDEVTKLLADEVELHKTWMTKDAARADLAGDLRRWPTMDSRFVGCHVDIGGQSGSLECETVMTRVPAGKSVTELSVFQSRFKYGPPNMKYRVFAEPTVIKRPWPGGAPGPAASSSGKSNRLAPTGVVRFRCPGGHKPMSVRTGCMCGNEILNPCKTGGLEPTLEGDTCVFHCPDSNTKLPPPKDEMEKCLQKCNDETGWRFMGQCQMQCEGEAK